MQPSQSFPICVTKILRITQALLLETMSTKFTFMPIVHETIFEGKICGGNHFMDLTFNFYYATELQQTCGNTG